MRIADRIREVLVQNNFEDVFMVTGGMAMHLNDALTRNNKIKPTFFIMNKHAQWLKGTQDKQVKNRLFV